MSKSQLHQDIFVLSQLGYKRNGFFVEFGAADGVYLSNTYLLEKSFGWTGVLAEPARTWLAPLQMNRSARIETRCVWKDSYSSLAFSEVDESSDAGLSTLTAFSDTDRHREKRSNSREYTVETISLLDLLEEHNAPPVIDYLSIDTEGSEFEILREFDFSKYQFRVITCEHNYTPMREQIFELLTEHGYRRVLRHISRWDDWYVLEIPE